MCWAKSESCCPPISTCFPRPTTEPTVAPTADVSKLSIPPAKFESFLLKFLYEKENNQYFVIAYIATIYLRSKSGY